MRTSLRQEEASRAFREFCRVMDIPARDILWARDLRDGLEIAANQTASAYAKDRASRLCRRFRSFGPKQTAALARSLCDAQIADLSAPLREARRRLPQRGEHTAVRSVPAEVDELGTIRTATAGRLLAGLGEMATLKLTTADLAGIVDSVADGFHIVGELVWLCERGTGGWDGRDVDAVYRLHEAKRWLSDLRGLGVGYIFSGLDSAVVVAMPEIAPPRSTRSGRRSSVPLYRLHCDTGPAVTWPEGDLRLWFLDGIEVPQHVVERPAEISVAEIDNERNVEVRRILLSRYVGQTPDDGLAPLARYVRDAERELIDEDPGIGKLWEGRSPVSGIWGERRVMMVEVQNSTREPDGSYRVYWLRVPPHMRTAREAVAWTFYLQPHEYLPILET